MSLGPGYLIVAFGSGAAGPLAVSGVPSSKQKFRERSVYVRLQVGQRFICGVVVRESLSANTPIRRPKIIENPTQAQALINFPQRPQNFVPAG